MAKSMQDSGVDLNRSHFFCSVCLDLLKEPVTLVCGHSYCRSCIDACWDQEEKRGRLSCPQCREQFPSRPVLGKSNLLAKVVEKLKEVAGQPSPAASLACASPEEVACDFCCLSSPSKATMSCLTCLASYCPVHLGPHYSVPVLKRHQLVSVTVPLHRKMCTKHNKLMDVYCETDKRCICYLCTIDNHKCHKIVPASAARNEEQKRLISKQKTLQQKIQEREDELRELDQAGRDFQRSAEVVMDSMKEMSDDLISFIRNKCISAKEMVLARQRATTTLAEMLRLELDADIANLLKRHSALEQLSLTKDDIHFIQVFRSLSGPCGSPRLPPGAVVRPAHSMEVVTDCFSELKKEMEDLVESRWSNISARVSAVDVVLPPVPKTREDFLRYCCPLSLDGNSVHRCLSISKERQQVRSYYARLYLAHPDRFMAVKQVLCREGLTKRCYWEVTRGSGTWAVAVAYKHISRGSLNSAFGYNDKSWSLDCSPDRYTFRHSQLTLDVSGPPSSTIGVYLDYRAGTLSFYSVSVSDQMTLLHKEQTSFTGPLYPGLGLRDAASQTNCWAEFKTL